MTRSFKIDRKFVPLLATIGLFVVGYLIGAIQYPGMRSPQAFFNLFCCTLPVGRDAVHDDVLEHGVSLSD